MTLSSSVNNVLGTSVVGGLTVGISTLASQVGTWIGCQKGGWRGLRRGERLGAGARAATGPGGDCPGHAALCSA